MKFLVAMTLLAALHATGAAPQSTMFPRPGNGGKAPYMVVKQYEEFEERVYPGRKWATTSMEGTSYDAISSSMFEILFAYIQGENDQNIKIDMTKPVSTLVQPMDSSSSLYTMGFYLPEENQASPPNGGADVLLEDRPRMTILTREFGGYMTDEIIATEKQELADLIIAEGITDVDFTTYYTASYNSPFNSLNRRNEVWYVRQ